MNTFLIKYIKRDEELIRQKEHLDQVRKTMTESGISSKRQKKYIKRTIWNNLYIK